MNNDGVADNTAKDNCNLSLSDKLARFGDDGIPLIVPYGSKGKFTGSPFDRYMYGYQKRTRADTLKPDYQRDLHSKTPHNVAMRQGGGLTRVVAFDVDTLDESILEELLLANPKLRNTFWTKAAKGPTIWFKIKGPYLERKHTIDVEGHKIEWRGGGYSIIHGKHPDGMMYEVVNPAELVEIEWAELTCPDARWSKTWMRLNEPGPGETKAQPVHLSDWQIKKRREYVEREYEVLDWSPDFAKAKINCKNKDQHSTDTGEGQSIIFIGADEKGIASYYCSHAHCTSEDPDTHLIFNKEESTRLRAGFMANETFILHSQNQRLEETIRDLYEHMASLGCFYRRSENMPFAIIYWRPGMSEPLEMVPETLVSCLGPENILFSKVNAKGRLVSCLATDSMAKVILSSPYAARLPIVKLVNNKALLCKTADGAQVCGNQYVRELETIILGETESLPELKFSEGLALINSLLDFWVWKEPADRARAWAELLTPAMLQGGFLKRPIPAMLMMADEPHAGKTFWHSCVSWIYGYEPNPHVHSKYQSIGSLEEQLKYGLSRGVPFFFIDELDGTIKNTFVNALITGGDEINVRIAYGRFANVSTEKLMIQLAGVKGFIIDPQLATRTIPIRVLKPTETGTYHWAWPDGTLVKNWIKNEGEKLLAAIYSVIAEWDRLGSPEEAAESRFPSWSIPINGLLTKVLNLPHATLELEDIQGEVSSVASMWWPDFFKFMVEENLIWRGEGPARYFNAQALQVICEEAGIGVPGSKTELRDHARIRNQCQQLHAIISQLPKARETNGRHPIYRCGEHYVIQYEIRDPRSGRAPKHYVVSSCATLPGEIVQFVFEDQMGWET
jgi:hypothetical protein